MSQNTNNINTKRGGGVNYYDSGPMALSTYFDECLSPTQQEIQLISHSNSATVTGASEKLQPAPAPTRGPCVSESVRETNIDQVLVREAANYDEQPVLVACNRSAECQPAPAHNDNNIIIVPSGIENNNTTKCTSFSAIVQKDGEWKEPKRSDEWVQIQKRRLRNRLTSQKGCAIESEPNTQKFRAADIKVPLFISNVDKEVSEQDIINYVYEKTRERVSLVKINMKRHKAYDAYKVFVTRHKIEKFLDDKLWPEGISFRRFVNVYGKQPSIESYK